jgi:hypothetical protein
MAKNKNWQPQKAGSRKKLAAAKEKLWWSHVWVRSHRQMLSFWSQEAEASSQISN